MRHQTAARSRALRLGLVGTLAGLALACGGSVEGPAAPPAPDAAAPAPSAAANLPAPNPTPPAAPPRPTQEQLDALEARVEEAPADAAARRRLAIALFAAHRREDAVEQFERIAADVGDDPAALLDLANAYGFVSRMDEAVATYRRALAIEPGNASVLFNLAEIAFLRGRVDEAIEDYRKSLAARPDYLRAHYQLARALEHRGDFREAYKTYAAALELDPGSPEELEAYDDALYRMAALDLRMGAAQRAEDMLVALLEANPNHPSAHYAYAQLLLQSGRLAEAQQQLEAHMTIRAATAPTTQVATGG